MVGEAPAAASAAGGAGYVPPNPDPYAGHEILLRLCGRRRSVVDAGGSSGYVAAELQRRGSRVVVLDVDDRAVEAARAAGLEAHRVDLAREKPPLDAGAFDVLLCADVLEHLPDPVAALRRLPPLLRSDGLLVASVPNGAN